MSNSSAATRPRSTLTLHNLGVFCALAGAIWLGGAEAPTKLVTEGFSPFLISMGMVMGAFVARWSLPTLLKGTGSVFNDLRDQPHLIVWALLAGMLWAVANTLSIFAVRNVGLAIAFPLWNTNSLVGLFWGWVLFRELRGSSAGDWAKVLGGAAAIVLGATILAVATARLPTRGSGRAVIGIMAALGAGMLFGAMYIPYRKAYISGMNPLSFVTMFTFGELGAMITLGWSFYGSAGNLATALGSARPMLFWPFLGGFCWVVGDLFQQYAAKYVGIGRGIPLSNTNQLWGLAWGALVFGEFAGLTAAEKFLIVAGSGIMIAGAVSISMASPSPTELGNWRAARKRECDRYRLDLKTVEAVAQGGNPLVDEVHRRFWWEIPMIGGASAIFVWLALGTHRQHIFINLSWMMVLIAATVTALVICGTLLWRRTRFS